MGSANELDYHLFLSKDLNLLGSSEYQALNAGVAEVKKMLAAFLRKLKADC